MTLPEALPGVTGGVMTVIMHRCWANAVGPNQCGQTPKGDDLGLCQDHIDRFREWSEGGSDANASPQAAAPARDG